MPVQPSGHRLVFPARQPARPLCEGSHVDTQRRNKVLVWALIIGLVASMGLGVLLAV